MKDFVKCGNVALLMILVLNLIFVDAWNIPAFADRQNSSVATGSVATVTDFNPKTRNALTELAEVHNQLCNDVFLGAFDPSGVPIIYELNSPMDDIGGYVGHAFVDGVERPFLLEVVHIEKEIWKGGLTQQLLAMLGVNYPMGQLKENHGFVARIINPEFGGSALIQGIAFTETVGSSRGAGDAAFVPIVDWVAATNDFPVEYFEYFHLGTDQEATEGACFCKRCPANAGMSLAGYCPLCDCELGKRLADAAHCRFWHTMRRFANKVVWGGMLLSWTVPVFTPLRGLQLINSWWGYGTLGLGTLVNEGTNFPCDDDLTIKGEEFNKFCNTGKYCDDTAPPGSNDNCPYTCNEEELAAGNEPW